MHISFLYQQKHINIVCYTIQEFQQQYDNYTMHVFTTYAVDYVMHLECESFTSKAFL